MNDDGMLINLCGMDLAVPLSDAVQSDMETALDRLLMSNASGCNGFNNSID
ncbi:MAG: hypothetical protein JO345_06710 [Streptosporangiaceae bacterium]|nr:hypothetical protein [Streptosporangiaceae bacterium]